MSIFSKSADYDETSQAYRQPRKPWSAMQIMLAILGGFVALSLALSGLDRLAPTHGAAAPKPAEPAPQRVVTLVDALDDYKSASANCEQATTAMQSRSGTAQAALDACGDSLRAISDLPIIYGAQASALQSCIDMEGARVGGLSMIVALRENRGQPGDVMTAEQNYRTQFHWASFRCRSDLLSTRRALGIAP